MYIRCSVRRREGGERQDVGEREREGGRVVGTVIVVIIF